MGLTIPFSRFSSAHCSIDLFRFQELPFAVSYDKKKRSKQATGRIEMMATDVKKKKKENKIRGQKRDRKKMEYENNE